MSEAERAVQEAPLRLSLSSSPTTIMAIPTLPNLCCISGRDFRARHHAKPSSLKTALSARGLGSRPVTRPQVLRKHRLNARHDVEARAQIQEDLICPLPVAVQHQQVLPLAGLTSRHCSAMPPT